jgi:hypothetical protein
MDILDRRFGMEKEQGKKWVYMYTHKQVGKP